MSWNTDQEKKKKEYVWDSETHLKTSSFIPLIGVSFR